MPATKKQIKGKSTDTTLRRITRASLASTRKSTSFTNRQYSLRSVSGNIAGGDMTQSLTSERISPQASTSLCKIVGASPTLMKSISGIHHYNVHCNSCLGSVYGIRYKCRVCRLYDLCGKCKADNVHPHHEMTEIQEPMDDYGPPGRVILHENVTCDACEGRVYGTRYKCRVCRDYDLCHQCKGDDLHPQHDMMEIREPADSD